MLKIKSRKYGERMFDEMSFCISEAARIRYFRPSYGACAISRADFRIFLTDRRIAKCLQLK